jgi:AraC family transcriptional regulator
LSMQDAATHPAIEMLLLDLVFISKQKESNSSGWAGRVNEFLQDNWNEPLSLTALARETNVHPVTISKNFRKYFSCTLGEYTRKLKVEKAMGLIKASKSSLTDTAYACGFADQSHFTRIFKQQTGFLPKDYQRL